MQKKLVQLKYVIKNKNCYNKKHVVINNMTVEKRGKTWKSKFKDPFGIFLAMAMKNAKLHFSCPWRAWLAFKWPKDGPGKASENHSTKTS